MDYVELKGSRGENSRHYSNSRAIFTLNNTEMPLFPDQISRGRTA